MGLLGIATDYRVDKYLKSENDVAITTVTESADPKTVLNGWSPGIEINPANGENIVFTKIKGSSSFLVSVGGVNQKIAPDTARGERRIYSVSEDGETIKSIVKLKNDGTLELNGATDSAVKFADLKTAYDELNNKYNKLITTMLAWVPVPNDGGTALKVALVGAAPLNSTGNIDPAESADVKIS